MAIWKNEEKYVIPGFNLKDEIPVNYQSEYIEDTKQLLLNFQQPVDLKRIEYRFSDNVCKEKAIGTATFVSSDGINYQRRLDEINDFTSAELEPYNADFAYQFAGDRIVSVRLLFPPEYPCDPREISIKFFAFKHLVEGPVLQQP